MEKVDKQKVLLTYFLDLLVEDPNAVPPPGMDANMADAIRTVFNRPQVISNETQRLARIKRNVLAANAGVEEKSVGLHAIPAYDGYRPNGIAASHSVNRPMASLAAQPVCPPQRQSRVSAWLGAPLKTYTFLISILLLAALVIFMGADARPSNPRPADTQGAWFTATVTIPDTVLFGDDRDGDWGEIILSTTDTLPYELQISRTYAFRVWVDASIRDHPTTMMHIDAISFDPSSALSLDTAKTQVASMAANPPRIQQAKIVTWVTWNSFDELSIRATNRNYYLQLQRQEMLHAVKELLRQHTLGVRTEVDHVPR